MSKCPFQIYRNEKYLESCQSVHPSNDVVKKTVKECHESGLLKPQKYEQNCVLENERDKILQKNRNCYKNNSLLHQYLTQHRKSIEAYRNLQKQQEEVLNLCKQKIARRFPSSMKASLKDEDIIKALKIAENSNYRVPENPKSRDRMVHAVLDVIMSTENHSKQKSHTSKADDQIFEKVDKKFRTEIAVSEYFNPKRKSVFSKFMRFLAKPSAHKTYLTASDNYFNKSKYIINTSTMGVVQYPGKSDEGKETPNQDDKKKTFNHGMHKYAGDSWHSSKDMRSDSSSNSSLSTGSINKKKKKKTYQTYYCSYQRDVDFLKSEVKKQQDEIKSIQKNLNLCLAILKLFEEKTQNNKNNFFNGDTQAYHILTHDNHKPFQRSFEPYSQYYAHYRAETDKMYDGQASSSNGPSSSSDGRRKCCCCRKRARKKKEKKGKKNKSKELQTTPKSSETKPKKNAVTEFSDPLVTGKGEGSDKIDSLKSGTPTDSYSSDGSRGSRRKRRKARRRKRKEARAEARARKKREKALAKEGRPRRSCFIRFCKFLFCSSCCT